MRPGRLRPVAVPQSTDTLWETAATTAVTENNIGASDRTIVLHSTRRQDANRHVDTRYAAQWRLIQLALYDSTMTH